MMPSSTSRLSLTMTNIKILLMGALLGTLFGATFLGAISHLLVIGLAVVGAATAALAVRRHRLPEARARKDLKRADAERTDSGV